MQSWLYHQWTAFYLLIFSLTSFLLFLYGFFPMKYQSGNIAKWDDLPIKIDETYIDGQEIYTPSERSVVLMVLDALRYDFVTEEYMPYTRGLLDKREGCIHIALAEPPTVTMPRIKAMMTGSVSTFADVALNFGAPAVRGDSILKALSQRGKKSVMYGDDTWLRLFPGLWNETDGTTSFFVTDFTEVDQNVTRHLESRLTRNKKRLPTFDFLVLHYLGLDHIGHLEGAKSPKIKSKLLEMDDVIETIVSYMKTWRRKGVLVLCGDHGMRDAGGHGGSSPAELIVPIVTFEIDEEIERCKHDVLDAPIVTQTDVAVTLAWWLGTQIPADSSGTILKSALPNDTLTRLYLLHYNALQNSKMLIATFGESAAKERECYKQYERAEKNFGRYLEHKHKSAAKNAEEFYQQSLNEMSSLLSLSVVEFDIFAIVLAIILLFLILVSLLMITTQTLEVNKPKYTINHSRRHITTAGKVAAFIIVMFLSASGLTIASAITENNTLLTTTNPLWITVILYCSFKVAFTFFIIKAGAENPPDVDLSQDINSIDTLLIFGTVIHSLTFFGTSFIEEEHQTWYFLWNSLMFLILLRTFGVIVNYYIKKCEGATEVQDKPTLGAKISAVGISVLPKWILLMALHRFLRTMNQTGDRWAFLPDTSDWLNQPENIIYLQGLMFIGNLLTLVICLCNLRYTMLPYIQTLLTIGAMSCIILYRILTGTIPFGENDFFLNFNNIDVVTLFWLFLFLSIGCECLYFIREFSGRSSKKVIKEKNEDVTYNCCRIDIDELKLQCIKSISHLFLNNMMMIIILLMRPHNVIMVPSIYFTCVLTSKCIEHSLLDNKRSKQREVLDIVSQTLVHFWIGYLFFFYQGNSNSLATVDLGSGYVGLNEYSAWRVALRMGIHSYAGPALSGMILFTILTREKSLEGYMVSVWRAITVLATLRVYTLFAYSCVATIFRDHLFVWTVFSPKLLYDLVATVFSVIGLFTIIFICGLAGVLNIAGQFLY